MMQSRAASMTTLDKLDSSLPERIRISTMICYASRLGRIRGPVCPACDSRLQSSAGPSCRRGSGLAQPRPALEVDHPPAQRAVVGLDHVLPLERVVASHARVTAGP